MEISRWSWGRIQDKIEQKSDLDVVDMNGHTALYYACLENYNPRFIKRILDAGADPNKYCGKERGDTPLLYVSTHGNADIAKLLLEYGADPNVYSCNGSTPLTTVARWGSVYFLKLLIDNGADVNMRAKDGTTALFHATSVGAIRKVKMLVESGADIELQNKRNRNGILIIALEYQYEEIILYFISLSPDINPLLTYKNFDFYFKNSMEFRDLIEKKVDTLTPENLKKWKAFRLKRLFA